MHEWSMRMLASLRAAVSWTCSPFSAKLLRWSQPAPEELSVQAKRHDNGGQFGSNATVNQI